jgi:MOSC domain-containing protein YiiM
MGEPRWVKRFAAERRPGAYLRVLRPGDVRAGDRVEILDRPAHGVTIGESFHAWMHDADQLRRYLELDGLPADVRTDIRRKLKL